MSVEDTDGAGRQDSGLQPTSPSQERPQDPSVLRDHFSFPTSLLQLPSSSKRRSGLVSRGPVVSLDRPPDPSTRPGRWSHQVLRDVS